MNMDLLVQQSLEEAKKLTGSEHADEHTQQVAFKLACVAMAREKLDDSQAIKPPFEDDFLSLAPKSCQPQQA